MVYSKPQEFGALTLVFSVREALPPDGYYALSGGIPDPDFTGLPMTWVKETENGSGVLTAPTDWKKVEGGLVPVSPSGYRVLSDCYADGTVIAGVGFPTPVSHEYLMCVKETVDGHDYTALGIEGEKQGLYSETKRPVTIPDGSGILMIPGASLWFDGGHDGRGNGNVYVLNLPFQTWKGPQLDVPILRDYVDVPRTVNEVIDRKVTVPCTALTDKGKSPEWTVENSPVYTLQRKRSYTLVEALNLKDSSSPGEISQEVEVGVESTKSSSFSEKTGFKVGFEVGAEFEGLGAKVTGEASYELGYEESHSVSVMQNTTKGVKADAAARHTTALYVENHALFALRVDGSAVSDADDLDFYAGGSYVAVQYPPPSQGEVPPRVTVASAGT
ncbi:hypothetical protein [Kitasatospora sp. NPDC059327]|uniref:hypothetical protein n=1 Tax=Kitasatospora sp. NPDC059327 TaxID=3346803 RepID=UPI003696F969